MSRCPSSAHACRGRHVLAIEANDVEENLDVGILISRTQPSGSSATARNVLRSVGVKDNHLSVPSGLRRWNVGLYLSGSQPFYSGSSEDDLLEGLTIERNVVEGHYAGLEVFGGVAERKRIDGRRVATRFERPPGSSS